MRNKPLILAGCALFLLFSVCIPLWRSEKNAEPPKVAVTFRGFTNDSTGSRLASFQVINQTGGRVFCFPFFVIEAKGQLKPLATISSPKGIHLTFSRPATFSAPAPTNDAQWRAVFYIAPDTLRRRLSDLPMRARRFVPSQFLSTKVQEAYSEWIGDGPTQPDPAPKRERLTSITVRRPSTAQLASTNKPVSVTNTIGSKAD